MPIQARRFAARSSTRQTTHLNSGKKVNSTPSETGRSPLNRLANRPIILRSSAYLEFYSFYIFRVFFRFVYGGTWTNGFYSFYIFRVFFRSVLFRAAFFAPSFLLPKIHFAAITQSFFFFTKTIVNGNFPLKLHFEPFTLFLWSVVRLNCAKRLQKLLYFFQGIISKSQKSCEFG